ncbi:helicase SNF2 [Variovorax sp. LjRoot290]|jgi:hypothetical protein|uniref:helicase SNF2 n=1 Tax=Variovorax sp. LjRoot290 TaxID=3342316 RepID=UPI003ECE99CC
MQVSKNIRIAAIATLAVLSAIGVRAEEYEGVLKFDSTAVRSEVRADAAVAARMPNPYAEGAESGPAEAVASVVDRTSVRTQAYAAARAGNPFGEAASAGVMAPPLLARAKDRERAL